MLKIAEFRAVLLRWFQNNARQYPWRETDDPYKVLIAELMLRRTKADQVKPVYEQFIELFPDAEALDNADENQVAEVVYSLGLHWRSPAFKQVVRELRQKYDYEVPETREELVELPGVGDYVAGAILSVAYRKNEWIVDANVARVFKRYYGLETIKEARRDKQVVALAQDYASGRDPRRSNLAILDFAALLCLPRGPKCDTCPLVESCSYPDNE